MNIRIFCTVLFILFLTFSYSQNETFLKANNAFNESDFTTAINLYEGVLQDGKVSPELYLNLANAYLKSNNIGKAILNYERGLKMNPGHQQLAQNLSYAEKQIEVPITAIPDFFLARYWQSFYLALSSGIWSLIQIMSMILITISVGFWLLSKELKKKRTAFFSLIFFCFLLMIALIAGIQRTKYSGSITHAVVMNNKTGLLSSASDQSELLLSLSEGIKVRILDQIGDYLKVELMDKEVGWIMKENLIEF